MEVDTGTTQGRRWRDEQAVLQLAAKQHGAVTREQLLYAGLSVGVVDRLVGSGRLRRLHRGVYAVAALTGLRTHFMAAVLACGRAAALSHLSAGILWALLRGRPDAGDVDITVSTGDRRRPGIRLHRSRDLETGHIHRVDGIPVTSAARTLVDIASLLSKRTLERACVRAVRRGLTSTAEVQELLSGSSRRGAKRLGAVLRSMEPGFTRSEAEYRFLELVRRAQLGVPQANAAVSGYEVDFFWSGARLIVEIDGFAFHSSRSSFESDRRRDAVLTAQGFRIVRVTWRQLSAESEAVIARIAQALALPASA